MWRPTSCSPTWLAWAIRWPSGRRRWRRKVSWSPPWLAGCGWSPTWTSRRGTWTQRWPRGARWPPSSPPDRRRSPVACRPPSDRDRSPVACRPPSDRDRSPVACRPPYPHVHAGRVVGQRLPARRRQPGGGDQVIIYHDHLGPVQRPGRVVGPREPVPGARAAEQDPPGGEEVVPVIELAGPEPVPHADPHPAGDRPRARPPPLASVGDLPAVGGQPHPRPVVGQPVGGAGHGNRTR